MTDAPKVVVIGAGRMGRGIAIAFAYAGITLDVVDFKPRAPAQWASLASEAGEEVRASLELLAQLGALPSAAVAPVAARVRWVGVEHAQAAIAAADVIFEAVPETLEAKRDALARVCALAHSDAILASTTSTILVTDLAPMVTHAQRLINAHWLNPAYLMPLVELSPHSGTSQDVRARLAELLERIGKVTVTCAAAPGFIVPRLQALIMNEAARMIEEGVASAQDIDTATRYGLGLRFAALGVVEFIDFGGVDILHHASAYLAQNLSAQRYTAPAVVSQMVQQGRIGVKSGSGFYDHPASDLPAYRRDVMQRVLAMVRHVRTYRDAVVDAAP